MKHYYIYKIICLCDEWNGKFYIGKHYGDINDNYTGSGKLIREYFKEFGKERDITYEKIILEIGDENSICDLEREYIREGMKSELCLNLVFNSFGGSWSGKKFSDEHRRKIGEANKKRKGKHIGRKTILKDENVKRFIIHSYQNGMRIKDIILILKRDFGLDFSDRTLYRFIVKNCPDNRYRISHPNGKNKVED